MLVSKLPEIAEETPRDRFTGMTGSSFVIISSFLHDLKASAPLASS